ncbi:MAG TPA: hypothetical protein VNY31_10025 [Solirubrobacteraceae bacterium]|nr:hypothetical protein [Solirubrobacteraceae bacterium]
MSDLEAQASPLLTPLIKGETANLIVDDQTFISKWATKTMLMCQLPNPNDQIIPISDYHDFFYDKAASKFSELFLACYRGSKLEFIRCTQMHLDKPDTPPGIIPDGYRFVLIIGCFVLEVAGSCNEELLGPTFPGMLGDALVEIWPATVDRSWPPRIVLDDVSILLFLGMPPGVEIP